MQKKDSSPSRNSPNKAQAGLKNRSPSPTKPTSKSFSKASSNLKMTKCGSCNKEFSMQDTTKHFLTCPQITRKCYIGRCSFEGLTEEFLEHIRLDHAQDLLSMFAKDIPLSLPEELNPVVSDDRIASRKNKAGLEARLGSTGKYYCTGKLNGLCHKNGTRGCCDGYCGPSNGCNCRACMELDIESRRLPKGYWVNRAGMKCTKAADGKIYCGTRHPWHYGKHCDPTEGMQCSACESLEFQLADRYYGL